MRYHNGKRIEQIVLLLFVLLLIFYINTNTIDEISNDNKEQSIIYTSEYLKHSPINITSNSDFASKALAEGWPGNGTRNSPYVLSQMYFEAQVGISIANTSVYFTIEQCEFRCELFGGIAIRLTNVTNGIIQQSIISDSRFGIIAEDSTITIHNNTFHNLNGLAIAISQSPSIITDNYIEKTFTGIDVNHCNGSKIIGNNIYRCTTDAIILYKSVDIFIENNTIINSFEGISIFFSNQTVFNYNWFVNATLNVWSEIPSGWYFESFQYNYVNGQLIGYFKNITGTKIDCTQYGLVILTSSSNVTLTNLQVTHSIRGALIGFSNNCTITNTTISYSRIAISIENSRAIIIINLKTYDTVSKGIYLYKTNNSMIEDCIFTGASYETSCIGIDLIQSNQNLLHHNLLQNCYLGVRINSGSSNIIYNNLFWKNYKSAADLGSDNKWDYKGVGNYWSDLSGTAYIISEETAAIDHYPKRLDGVEFRDGTFYPIDYTQMPSLFILIMLSVIGLMIFVYKTKNNKYV